MKATTPIPAQPRSAPPESQADPWIALARQQFEVTNRIARSMLHGVENLRRCQLEAAQRTREQHEQAQGRLAGSGSASQVLEVEAELVGANLQAALQHGQQMWSVCAAAGIELLEEWNAGVRETGEQWARVLPTLGTGDAGAAYGRRAASSPVQPGVRELGAHEPSAAAADPAHRTPVTANEIERIASQLWKPWIHTVEPWRAMLLPRIELP